MGVGVGLLPLFSVVLFGLLSDETQIWLGDLRVVCGCVGLVFFGFHLGGDAAGYMTTASCA